MDGTSLGTYLFLYGGIEESLSYALNYGIAAVLLAISVFSLFKIKAGPLFVMGVIFATQSVFKTILGGSFASDLTIAAHMVRFSWPLLFALVIQADPSWESLKRKDVSFFFRLFISTTFFVHGVEALMMHPKFIDFIIVTNSKWGFMQLQRHRRQALLGIVPLTCSWRYTHSSPRSLGPGLHGILGA